MPLVTVNTYANLRKFTDGQPSVQCQIEAGISLRKLLQKLEIPFEEAKIVFVNHRAGSLDRTLQGGEQIDLFSAIGGG